MFKTTFGLFLIVCVAAAAIFGRVQTPMQSPSVEVPVLGFVADGTNGIRPMLGIPGSATIGTAWNFGVDILRAEVSPNHDYIVAMTRDGNWPSLLHRHGAAVAVRSLDTYVSPELHSIKIDRMALSPTGSAAAFFSNSQGRLYVFNGLSHVPALIAQIEAGQFGSMSSFAISDDGKTLLFGVSNPDEGGLFSASVGATTNPLFLASMRRPSAITFARESNDAIAADDLDNKVYRVSGNQVLTIATADHGISGPIAVALSNDGRRVFIGNSTSASVTTMDRDGILGETIWCQCVLTGIHPTATDSVFRLTDFSGGPIVLLDASSPASRIIFAAAGSQ